MKLKKRNREENEEHEASSQACNAPVHRQVHILNEGIIIPFLSAWMEMIFNFILFPVSLLIVFVIQPLISGMIFFLNIPSRIRLRSRKAIKLNGHESFWLARTIGETKDSYLKCSNVVIITVKGLYNVNSFKDLLLNRVVDHINPSTKRRMFPRFSQKLSRMSFGRAWVVDTDFDINNHVLEITEELLSTSQVMQLACNSATLPFMGDRPRWRVYFLPRYPETMSTIIFSCDPAMADGVYLLNVLHSSIVDNPPKEFMRRHFGAFNQEVESVRSVFGGLLWFFRNLFRFDDNMDVLRMTSRNDSPSDVQTAESEEDQQKTAMTEITVTSSDPSTAVSVSSSFSPFPSQSNLGFLPKRKFLVFGPISLGNKMNKIMDVTKATLDEIILAILSSSLRDYFYHNHQLTNPIEISACLSVALQGSRLLRNPADKDDEAVENRSNSNVSATHDSTRHDSRSLVTHSKDDSNFETRAPTKLKKHSNSFNNPLPGPSGNRGHLNDQLLSPRSFLHSPQEPERSSVDKTQTSPPPRVLFHKPRSFSVGVVPQMSSIPRAFHSQVHANFSNNADSKQYAKTIETPHKFTSDYHDSFSSAKCSKMTHAPRLSVMKIRMPVSVEGALPSLWYIKNRIIEQKTESSHISFYRATRFLNKFLPSHVHRRLMNRLYGQASVAYHSLVGSKSRLTMDGNQIRNIFFWGPLRVAEGVGVSCMTYLDNLTITLNVDDDLVNPENIFEFFIKKMDDMKELLKYRRIKQQPRTDTILVTGKKTSLPPGIVDDDVGEEVELRRHRSGRIKASISHMRRNSMAVLTSLSGSSRPR